MKASCKIVMYLFCRVCCILGVSMVLSINDSLNGNVLTDPPTSQRVLLGNEILRDSNYAELYGSRLLILGNPTSCFQDNLKHLVDDLHEKIVASKASNLKNSESAIEDQNMMKSITLVGVLSPEHGFRGDKQAESGDPTVYIDKTTKLPVWSAYKMSIDDLSFLFLKENITTIVIDIQDVGVRLYTFVWTMQKVMKAASIASLKEEVGFVSAQHKSNTKDNIKHLDASKYKGVARNIQNKQIMKILVLDRPNPLGGVLVDGPLLNMTCCASGYGNDKIPHIHGMTIGELSYFFFQNITSNSNAVNDFVVSETVNSIKYRQSRKIEKAASKYFPFFFQSDELELVVFPVHGWSRSMMWKDTGLRWVPPSPNLPTPESSLTYSSTVFLEATTVSEGRGTCTPFSQFGAPFISNLDFVDYLNSEVKNWSLLLHKNKRDNTLEDTIHLEEDNIYECFRASFFNPVFFKYNNTIVDGVQWFPYCTWPIQREKQFCNGECLRQRELEISTLISPFTLATIILRGFITLSMPSTAFYFDGSWFGHPGTQLIDYYSGTFLYRQMLEDVKNYTVEDIVKYFQDDIKRFTKDRHRFLFYD